LIRKLEEKVHEAVENISLLRIDVEKLKDKNAELEVEKKGKLAQLDMLIKKLESIEG